MPARAAYSAGSGDQLGAKALASAFASASFRAAVSTTAGIAPSNSPAAAVSATGAAADGGDHGRMAEGGDIAAALQNLFVEIHRARDIDREHEFEVNRGLGPGWLRAHRLRAKHDKCRQRRQSGRQSDAKSPQGANHVLLCHRTG